MARVPCSPPPCTAATSRTAVRRPAGRPPRARRRGPPRRPAERHRCRTSRRGRGGEQDGRAKPIWNTTHVIRITPPTRATPASGPPPATCRGSRVARRRTGTRSATPRRACGPPGGRSVRHRPVGAASAARPWKKENTSAGDEVTGRRQLPHPAHAHEHPAGAERRAERRTRSRRVGSAPRATSNSATPTTASGHQPHGGSERATANPAAEGERAGA